LSHDGPIDAALVSVTQNGSCREEYIRSAAWYSAHVPSVIQDFDASRPSGTASASCMT
jgi:hypothetical protein